MCKPFIKKNNLVVPLDTPQKYRWWAGGQSITATLNELSAPHEVMRKYTNPGGMAK